MTLHAIKRGRYGFSLTASVYPALKPEEGWFVFLESLEVGSGVVSVNCEGGTYHIKVVNSVEVADIVEFFEKSFLGQTGYVPVDRPHFEGSLDDKASMYLYSVLLQILLIASPNETAYAMVGIDGEENPVQITISYENLMVN